MSARGVRRTGCRTESRAVDARSFSTRPCCPGFDRETHVAGRKTRLGGKGRRYAAPEFAKRAPALTKRMPDEATPRFARRDISPAKARGDYPVGDRLP